MGVLGHVGLGFGVWGSLGFEFGVLRLFGGFYGESGSCKDSI